MTRARRRAILAAGLALVLVAVAAFVLRPADALGPRADRPVLLLLTSLPIVFGQDLSLDQAGSPLLDALEKRYRVRPIATASAAELEHGKLLLMAQPLAQPAEDLVALDRWVRGGGRVLLLADPVLEWPDDRSLDDPTRPQAAFMDTGLLMHWGLQLSVPTGRGERHRLLAGHPIVAVSPGELSGNCPVEARRAVARCALGFGQAIVVADADFIDWRREFDSRRGARAILAALDRLERA